MDGPSDPENPGVVDERFRVAAWIAGGDVPHLIAALGPAAVVVPCNSIDALTAVVRSGAAAAIVGGVDLTKREISALAALIAWCPTTVIAGLAVPPLASNGTLIDLVQSWVAWETPRLAQPGARGVCHSVNDGDWHAVSRSLASARLPDPAQRACVAAVLGDVWLYDRTGHWCDRDETSLLRFFAAAFGPGSGSVDQVAEQLGVETAVLERWFCRRGLPGAVRYIAGARLVRAAWTGEPVAPEVRAAAAWHPHPEASARIHQAARRLRRLATLGTGPSRRRDAGTLVLNNFRLALVRPFEGALRSFDLVAEADR